MAAAANLQSPLLDVNSIGRPHEHPLRLDQRAVVSEHVHDAAWAEEQNLSSTAATRNGRFYPHVHSDLSKTGLTLNQGVDGPSERLWLPWMAMLQAASGGDSRAVEAGVRCAPPAVTLHRL